MKSIELRFLIEVQVDPTWSNKFWVCLWIWDPKIKPMVYHKFPYQNGTEWPPFPYVVAFKLMKHWNTPYRKYTRNSPWLIPSRKLTDRPWKWRFLRDQSSKPYGKGLSQASGPWTPTSLGGCRHKYNKPRKDVEKLKTWRFSERHHIQSYTYILIMLETLCGIFFGVPNGSHTSYKSSTEYRYGMYGRWLQNESKYQYENDWGGSKISKMTSQFVCWLMVSPCFNPKKIPKGSGILIPSSGFNRQLHRELPGIPCSEELPGSLVVVGHQHVPALWICVPGPKWCFV